MNPPYLRVIGGSISEDGSLAYIAEESLDGSVGRLRVFSILGMTVSIIPLPNINDVDISLQTSTEIMENKYTTVSYGILDGSTFILCLVDLSILTIIATSILLGPSSDGGRPFRLTDGGTIFVSVPIITISDDLTPAYEQIFKVKKWKLVEVKSARLSLPSFVFFHSVRIRDGLAIISLGTSRTQVPGIPSIDGHETPISNPFGEPSGLRIAHFNGDTLCISGLTTTNDGTVGYPVTALRPDGENVIAMIDGFISSIPQSITFKLEKEPSCNMGLIVSSHICPKKNQYKLIHTDNNYIVKSAINYSFSSDGKWFVAGGGSSFFGNIFPYVSVFKVYYSDCQ